MFQGWRFKLREVEQAMELGRLEDAARLLNRDDLAQFLPGKRMADRVALRLAERARQRVLRGETAAGWRDLDTALGIGGETRDLAAVRQEMIDLALDDVSTSLASQDTAQAHRTLDALERHNAACESVREYREKVRRLEAATHLAGKGRFADAIAQLERARGQQPSDQWIDVLVGRWEAARDELRELNGELHRAMGSEDWSKAVTTADRILELAPEHALAREARRRAWSHVGAHVRDSRMAETQVWKSTAESEGEPARRERNQFLLWVDAVGGFLVCLDPEIVLGQAAPGNDVDVPIQGDLSRRHARIVRRGEGYMIEPFQPVRVRGQQVREVTLLADGDEIEMGSGVRMRFRQPHSLSASARLEFLSRHRTQPAADGVLLMAESCVLGPRWHNHVVCRDWSGDVVLFRQDGELFCRAVDTIEIDGTLYDGRGPLTERSRVSGSDFSLCLEKMS